MPKGMILAAGLGERLRPLTEWLPKPLLPVANAPVMLQGVIRLREAGISEICANLSYKANELQEAFGNGSTCGIKMEWSREDVLLGTAGGMKKLEYFLGDDMVVMIAGDAMLDIDLGPIISAHREKAAIATIGTLQVEDCSQYGVAVTDQDGRILQFQEKPRPGTEISNQANTGIYVFDPAVFAMIPANTFYDFAHDVFPAMLASNMPLYACQVQGYWTDIGNPRAYLEANLDYLARRVRIEGQGERDGSNLIGKGAKIDGAQLTNCIIGPNAIVPSGSKLTECVVWANTVLPAPEELKRTIISPQGRHTID